MLVCRLETSQLADLFVCRACHHACTSWSSLHVTTVGRDASACDPACTHVRWSTEQPLEPDGSPNGAEPETDCRAAFDIWGKYGSAVLSDQDFWWMMPASKA